MDSRKRKEEQEIPTPLSIWKELKAAGADVRVSGNDFENPSSVSISMTAGDPAYKVYENWLKSLQEKEDAEMEKEKEGVSLVYAIVEPKKSYDSSFAPSFEICGRLQMECNSLIRNLAKFTKEDFENNQMPEIPPASPRDGPIFTSIDDEFILSKMYEVIQTCKLDGYTTLSSLKPGTYICDVFIIPPFIQVALFKT
jgi:hypothetical protein